MAQNAYLAFKNAVKTVSYMIDRALILVKELFGGVFKLASVNKIASKVAHVWTGAEIISPVDVSF